MSAVQLEKYKRVREGGYILVGVLILVAISAIMLASALEFTATNARTTLSERVRTREYYQAEDTLAKATTWLRTNSESLVSIYNRSNFYSTFDRTSPTYGTNEGSTIRFHTKIKLQGTNNSAILTQTSTLGTSTFPNTTNTSTGAAYNPVTQFNAGSFGNDIVRVTLVDAIPVDSTKDFGDPDLGNPAPQTDFYPVYRIDSMKAADRGGHVYGYAVGNLIYNYGVGFYGRDLMEIRQSCDSYLSNTSVYSAGVRRANCSTGSNATLQIHGSEAVYGSAQTNGAINTGPPFGGDVCSDFTSGCPTTGLTCQGGSCSVPGLPTYNSWSTYCPTNQGNLTISANTTLTVPGNAANQKCWATVSIGNNRTLTLTTTTYSYFIDTFDIPNNGVVNFAPSPSTATINLYVRKFIGDKFNGGQVFNTNNKPYQLRLHYLGTDALVLNGNAAMAAFMVAPNAGVSVQGSFEYYGGIKATSLDFTGSGDIHYDESGDITTLSNLQYSLRNLVEKYR